MLEKSVYPCKLSTAVTRKEKAAQVKKWKIYEKGITFFDSSGIDG